MKIAIVYDWIDKQGGVERLLTSLVKTFPEAEFFTSVYNPQTAPWAEKLRVHPSFMQMLPNFIKKSRILSALLYPFAFEAFNFTGYDLVISVTSSFAKGVVTRPETKHICILLTPSRYLWDLKQAYKRSSFFSMLAASFLSRLRYWDYVAAQRPDKIFAISKLVAARCLKNYNRKAEVFYPPFDRTYWDGVAPTTVQTPESYYLVVSRLEPYKKGDLVIDTFATLKEKYVIIVGSGSSAQSLQARAGKNVTFMSDVPDSQLAYLYQHAKGLIMPQEEDFGYTALEALNFNCPVITYEQSGAAEIVQNERTGLYFSEQTISSLSSALERFASLTYNVSSYREQILSGFVETGLIDKNNY